MLAIGEEGSFCTPLYLYEKIAYVYKYEDLEINIDDSPEKIIKNFLIFLKLEKKILLFVF